MSLHADLLAQARHLATKERTRPKQASLRRAVSTSYYAVFHLLSSEVARMMVPGEQLRARFARALVHSEMKDAAKAFAGATLLLPHLIQATAGNVTVPTELRIVAKAFINLQEARHEADYDVTRVFTRTEALDLVALAETAFSSWQQVRSSTNAKVFLAALVAMRRWTK